MEQEPENSLCDETEKHIDWMEIQNDTTELQSSIHTSVSEMERDEQLIEREQKQLTTSSSSQEPIIAGPEDTPLPSSCDLTDIPQTDHNQPVTTNGHVPAEKTDGASSEQSIDTVRRSERSKRPPGKFTYPKLGNPLISFAQSLVEGFNRVLVETFESNNPSEKMNMNE